MPRSPVLLYKCIAAGQWKNQFLTMRQSDPTRGAGNRCDHLLLHPFGLTPSRHPVIHRPEHSKGSGRCAGISGVRFMG